MKSKLLIVGLAALSLSACTSINPYTGQSQLSNTTGGALIGAGGGAVVGGIIGAATGSDPRVAALIGAGVGGLTGGMIGNYMDQQEAELRAQLQGTGVSVTRVGALRSVMRRVTSTSAGRRAGFGLLAMVQVGRVRRARPGCNRTGNYSVTGLHRQCKRRRAVRGRAALCDACSPCQTASPPG